MVRPRQYDEETIREWRIKARTLRRDSQLSKRKISRMIAENSKAPLHAVYYYVFGDSRKHEGHQKYLRYGSYSTPQPEYDLKYKHLIRRLDKLIPQFFNENSELSLAELTHRIEANVGIAMRSSTLEKLLGKYEGSEKGSPVVKTESGNYYLSEAYYRRNGKE